MRWDELFADLEGQYLAGQAQALAAEVRDRTRREASLLSMTDRLRPVLGSVPTVAVWGVGPVTGRLHDVGPDWLLVCETGGAQLLVPTAAVLGLVGVGRASDVPGGEGAVGRRLDLRYALRGLARRRAGVHVVRRDGSVVTGTLDRVGSDHLDVAEHPPGEPRRAGAVRQVHLVPLDALAVVRSSGG